VIGAFFILTLNIGVLSASKFRKGFDVDISEETEKDKPSENSNNRD
jgi:hypothetical protein